MVSPSSFRTDFRPHSQEMGAPRRIIVFMFNKEEPITFPSERQIQAEDLCFTAAKHCGIGRVARHLFALQNKRTCCYLSPCEWVGGDDQDVQLEFRLRFQVPDIERLQEVDEEALDYYFHQIRSDFLSERIPSVLDAKEKVLGLAVADMVRVIKEKGSSRDVTVKDYKKYLPRKLIQKMQWSFPWIKSDMRNNMEELNKSIEDASYIKVTEWRPFARYKLAKSTIAGCIRSF